METAMATTTDRQTEVKLTMKAVFEGPITDRELTKLLWYRDQKLTAALLNKTPTENGGNISQRNSE